MLNCINVLACVRASAGINQRFRDCARFATRLCLLLAVFNATAEQKPDSGLPSGIKLKPGIDLMLNSHQQSVESQNRVETLAAKAKSAMGQYLATLRQLRMTQAYNQQMRRLIESQKQEMTALESQIDSINSIEKVTLPLLNTMVEELRDFVEQDTPFLSRERRQRIARLQSILVRADISIAEKYRQILEAYMVELSYGRSIEAYTSSSNDQVKEVGWALGNRRLVFFRMGRMALYYQTLNGLESGLWLPREKRWQALTENQNLVLRKAIQMARQQRVPELIELPLPGIGQESQSSASAEMNSQ